MPRENSSKSRSKSHKGSSRQDKTSSHHKSHGQSGSARAPLSFIFVVNEVSITNTEADTWGNPRPPTSAVAYERETPSRVMRYRDGSVELAGDYYLWKRDDDNREGDIWCFDPNDNEWSTTETYRTATVFSCHPLMPFAMVQEDAMFTDTVTRDAGYDMSSKTWQPLLFYFPRGENDRVSGVSQAMSESELTAEYPGGGLVPYVAGSNPSWMPGLVPKTYKSSTGSQPSRGLGGELTILLALMTFSARRTPGRSRAEAVFLEPNARWKRNRWHHNRDPEGYTKSTLEFPQGLIITVALDPSNPQGSTDEALRAFEFDEVPVKESSGH